eukprot:6098164-Amphidinium_carterae.1
MNEAFNLTEPSSALPDILNSLELLLKLAEYFQVQTEETTSLQCAQEVNRTSTVLLSSTLLHSRIGLHEELGLYQALARVHIVMLRAASFRDMSGHEARDLLEGAVQTLNVSGYEQTPEFVYVLAFYASFVKDKTKAMELLQRAHDIKQVLLSRSGTCIDEGLCDIHWMKGFVMGYHGRTTGNLSHFDLAARHLEDASSCLDSRGDDNVYVELTKARTFVRMGNRSRAMELMHAIVQMDRESIQFQTDAVLGACELCLCELYIMEAHENQDLRFLPNASLHCARANMSLFKHEQVDPSIASRLADNVELVRNAQNVGSFAPFLPAKLPCG